MNKDDEQESKIQSAVSDHSLPEGQRHELVPANAHISRKVYWFPDSYNALRKELQENFPNLFAFVGHDMAFNAQRFILSMDEALDTITQFDSDNVDGICKKYLDKLREKRGLSALHKPSEYFHNQSMEDQVRAAREGNDIAPWKPKGH